MTFDQITLLLIVAAASTLYATHWQPYEVTAIFILSSLALTGLLSPAQALSGFSSSATLTVGAMFVLSAGLVRTGALENVTIYLARFSRGDPRRLLLMLAIIVPVASAFVNDTPVVVMMVPVILSLSARFNVRPSHLLLPLSYFAVLGGTLTLLGTSTNILLDNLYREAGGPGFNMFSFTRLGLIYTVVGGLFLYFVGHRLLPNRASLSGLVSNRQPSTYISEILVDANSQLIGMTTEAAFNSIATVGQPTPRPRVERRHRRLYRTVPVAPEPPQTTEGGVELLEIFRGNRVFQADETRELRIQPDDILMVAGSAKDITQFLASTNSTLAPVLADSEREETATIEQKVVEAVVLPDSRLNNRLIGELDLNRHYGVKVMGVQRNGRHRVRGLRQLRLLSGDVLLLQADEAALRTVSETEQLLLVEGVEGSILRGQKNRLALLIMLMVILLATFSPVPIVMLALAGAGLMVVTGCLRIDEAISALEPATLLLLVGAIPLGLAIETTGLAQTIVNLLLAWLGDANPILFLSIFYLLTNLIAQFLSAKAVAVLFLPVALSLAASLGISPTPLVIAIVFGTAAGFLTPMGHQVNAIVMGPGGYTFTDYVRIGLPMTLLMWLMGTIFIPLFWPL